MGRKESTGPSHTPDLSLQLPGLRNLCSDVLVCRSHACSFLIYLSFDKIGWLLEGNFQVDLSLEQSRAEHLNEWGGGLRELSVFWRVFVHWLGFQGNLWFGFKGEPLVGSWLGEPVSTGWAVMYTHPVGCIA